MKRLLLSLLFAAALMPATASAARILALTPHACEMLYDVGAGDQIVGAVSYCDYPSEAKDLPRIGSYERINVEAALRLQPDLAVVMSRSVGGVEILERMGITVMVSNPDSFETMFEDILKIGKLSGRSSEAESLVGKLRARLETVRAIPRSDASVFYEVWHDPMLTAGGPSFISDLIHQAGGRNIFVDIDVETPHVNVESVIRARPSVIVIPLEKRNLADRRQFWEGWLGKGNVRFVAIDPDLLHRPGPRLLDGLEFLQKALAGEKRP
ncbi:iron complex transport system substrate-binding protein [Mariprofundus ferrinatatus]|uniref:Iron complex transport system substrate-binding protein n=1 Tax=Mariprofundus ferrinatatus TaxID=1921087 RepID=A0A2K8L682_9PROT|nr:cobalamin-binding protein [Mariprofundus ferrinatatus]ATX82828.1 iron complex transport system substrate-binding protein [Mariprofundus ferrinatatus]